MPAMNPTRLLDALRPWPLYAALASAAMLAAAHAFERFGNMPPCALCLRQREVYWIALGLGLAGIAIARLASLPAASRALSALLAIAFATGAVVAGFHVGVELRFWPGLPECAAPVGNFDPGTDLLGALSQPMDVPRCDEVPWALFGISMAGWNMLVSLGLAALSLRAALDGHSWGETLSDTDGARS